MVKSIKLIIYPTVLSIKNVCNIAGGAAVGGEGGL